MLPLISFAQIDTPKTEKEFISRFIMERARDANINPNWFLATAICESGLRERVINPVSKTVGIFQIHPIHRKTYRQMNIDPFNFVDNVNFAVYLYTLNGKSPWLASKECSDKKMKTLALNSP